MLKKILTLALLALAAPPAQAASASEVLDGACGQLKEIGEKQEKLLSTALINACAAINAKNNAGNAPLHCAAIFGHTDTAKAFINDGADINVKDELGQTPLHCAVWNSDVVKILTAAGADINAKNNAGNAPLHCAAIFGHADTTKELIAAGANVNAKDNDGNTPLHCAAINWRLLSYANVKALIAYGADINSKNNDGKAPLHCAVYNTDVVKTLIAAGADVNAKDNDGCTPLQLAVTKGHIDTAKALIDAGSQSFEVEARFKSQTNKIDLFEILSLYNSRALKFDQAIDLSNVLQNDLIFKLAKLPNQKIIQFMQGLGKDQFLILLDNINSLGSRRLANLAIYCMLKSSTFAEWTGFDLENKLTVFGSKFGHIAKSACQKLQAQTNPEAALKIYEDLLPNLEDTLC